jgi:hypothetical protein
MHDWSHCVWPVVQPHTPLLQLSPVAHVVPQPPQFWVLCLVSTQPPSPPS